MIKKFNELNEKFLPLEKRTKNYLKVNLDDKVEVDLSGSDGSGLALLGYAAKFALNKGYNLEELKALLDDMQSRDYEHLLQVFDEHFGKDVILLR